MTQNKERGAFEREGPDQVLLPCQINPTETRLETHRLEVFSRNSGLSIHSQPLGTPETTHQPFCKPP